MTGVVEGSPELNDRERFQGLFRTDSTGEFLGEALAEIAQEFNWTQMAVISRGASAFLMVRIRVRSSYVATNRRFHVVCNYIKVAGSLNSIFETENRTLDTTITVEINNSFPYNLLHNLVRVAL